MMTKKNSLIVVFLFLFIIIPVHILAGDVLTRVRDVAYSSAVVCSLATLGHNIFNSKVQQSKIVLFRFILLFYSLMVLAVLGFSLYYFDGGQKHFIVLGYCVCCLVLGMNLSRLFDFHLLFSKIILVSWLLINLVVISTFDIQYFQSVYDKNNDRFVGAYQIVADIYSIASIVLISKSINWIFDRKSNKTEINFVNRILPYVYLLISLFILFLNGSRAGLFAFVGVGIYILYFNLKIQGSNSIATIGIICLIPLLIFIMTLLTDSSNSDVVLNNRNLELFRVGSSRSLDERDEQAQQGFNSILESPIMPQYIQRSLLYGQGTYIHNITGIWQDFGILSFFAYVGLCLFSVQRMIKNIWRMDYLIYNSVLIYSMIQILFFRYPLVFFPIFICFGANLFDGSPKNTVLHGKIS